MWQKGSAGLLISLLLSVLLIAGTSLYIFQGGFTKKESSSIYKQSIDQAKEAQIQADFHAVQTALESYRLNNGQYPDSLDQLIKASLMTGSQKNPYTGKLYDFRSDGKVYTLSTQLGDGNEFKITN